MNSGEPELIDLFPGVENEDDLPPASVTLFDGVVVNDSDWTTETIISQLAKGNISLDPKFQRRDAWTDDRKSRFIESLFLGVPIPQLVLAENPKAKGKYFVIDGKQRLLSLLRFASDHLEPLKLRDLAVRKDLNGHTWAEIKNGAGRPDDPSAFENATIRTTFIRGYRDENVLFLIFHRLNSGSVPLSPQELRHVLHPGPFIDFAFEFTEGNQQLISLLGRDGKPDFRMRDVELLIRFFAFRLFLDDYPGDLKLFLDRTVMDLNSSWERRKNSIIHLANECSNAIEATRTIFGTNAFSKFTGKDYEHRFNRAVFDVMALAFSFPELREVALKNSETVRRIFEDLCRKEVFIRSLETTTKSTGATQTRVTMWLHHLHEGLGIQESPKQGY